MNITMARARRIGLALAVALVSASLAVLPGSAAAGGFSVHHGSRGFQSGQSGVFLRGGPVQKFVQPHGFRQEHGFRQGHGFHHGHGFVHDGFVNHRSQAIWVPGAWFWTTRGWVWVPGYWLQ
jgi:hypothetical protein